MLHTLQHSQKINDNAKLAFWRLGIETNQKNLRQKCCIVLTHPASGTAPWPGFLVTFRSLPGTGSYAVWKTPCWYVTNVGINKGGMFEITKVSYRPCFYIAAFLWCFEPPPVFSTVWISSTSPVSAFRFTSHSLGKDWRDCHLPPECNNYMTS